MMVSPGGLYSGGYNPFYQARYEERAQIRRTSNGVCWTALAGVFLMSLVFPVAGELFLRAAGYRFLGDPSFDGMPPVLYYLLLGFGYVAGLAVPAFVYFSAKRVPLSEGIPFHGVSAFDLILYVAFGCLICMLANYPANLVSQLQEYFGFSGDLPENPLNNNPAVIALYGLSVVVIPPLVEEIMFRGVVLQSLRRYGDGFAVLVSAILFGLYHGNLIQMVFAFVSGLALGFVVIRTNSLLPSILIHCINNGISYAVEMVLRFYGQDAANQVNNIATAVLFVLGITALFVLAMRHKLFSGKRSSSALPFSSRMGAAFGSFGGIVFILYGIAMSVFMLYHVE
jgi:membrane protease YdiL (CAAX protease family)